MKNVRNLVFYAMCAAILVASKEILAFLPNIELVSFLLIVFAMNLQLKGSLCIAIIFCFVQTVLYGFGLWTPMYFIVWPFLVLLTYGIRKRLKNYHYCAIFSAVFGLSFGFLFSIPYFFVSWNTGWIYFLKGIPFDLIHGVGNYILMVMLYDKCTQMISHLHERYGI